MLLYLNIKNFAIISEIELDLQAKMTVLTGETGAGKSIIVDTLDLVFGARSDNSIIRAGSDRCEIVARFDLNFIPDAREWLIKQEFSCDSQGNECLIRRIICRDGRTRTTINGFSCTQQAARELGGLLLNIYGQHEHQSLLKRDKQRNLLDAFAQHRDLCVAVKDAYKKLTEARSELAALQRTAYDGDAKLEFLRYQLQELENLSLGIGEVENLHTELQRLSEAENKMAGCNAALALIAREDDAATITKSLHDAKVILEKIGNADAKLDNVKTLLSDAAVLVESAYEELRAFLTRLEQKPDQMRWIESRLNDIYDIARKHRVKPEALSEVQISLHQALQQLEKSAENIERCERVLQEYKKIYLDAARKLTTSRKEAAKKLSELVSEKMQHLGMEGGYFAIDLQEIAMQDYSAEGMEEVEFLVSANRGQPLLPLAKVASGGELSRLSLAIQVITSACSTAETMIFDEVDVGIGGKTAEIVGQLLKKLGDFRQIICITHLPQVAAHGDQHLKVEKRVYGSEITLSVEYLSDDSRIVEIARMLGGINVTKKTLAHAQEMLSLTHLLSMAN